MTQPANFYAVDHAMIGGMEGVKRCSRCREEKPLEAFGRCPAAKDGLRWACKTCRGIESTNYHRANRGRRSALARKRWPAIKVARALDPPEVAAARLASRRRCHGRNRAAALAAYGGRCALCGEDFDAYLVIDHVDGGGREHKRGINGTTVVDWLKKAGYPSGYQVLCASCNREKGAVRELSADPLQVRRRARRHALRLEVLAAYGGACRCCGTHRALEVDHVDGDGGAHRAAIGFGELDAWLKRQGFPPGYQLLCANCHLAKTRGVRCHHQLALDWP